MKCANCGKDYRTRAGRCPHCGHPAAAPAATGVFQTSIVMIHEADSESIYRSVEEVPQPLRSRLLKSTNSPNSATLLIADRRGRQEIARAMRSMPAPVQKRLMNALLGPDEATGGFRIGRRARVALAAALALLIALLVWLEFAMR